MYYIIIWQDYEAGFFVKAMNGRANHIELIPLCYMFWIVFGWRSYAYSQYLMDGSYEQPDPYFLQ